jgi:hypothetical protein
MAGSRWAPAPRGDVAAAMPASGLQRQVGLHGEDDQAARRRKQGEDDEAAHLALVAGNRSTGGCHEAAWRYV